MTNRRRLGGLRGALALALLTLLVLENGMRFLFVQRGDAPVFHGMIRFNVGGVDEVPGITGLAHLFEHMAFKGTPVIGTKDFEAEQKVLTEIDEVAREHSRELGKWRRGDPERLEELGSRLKELQKKHKELVTKDEFTQIYNTAGGKGLNATTSKDFTTYFLSLPENKLELWMLMESERLVNLERDVVREERKMRTENSPGGALYEAFINTAIIAHPQRLPTVGWDSDIRTVTKEQAQRFYDAYYSPRNSVAALVGNFDLEKAKAMAKRYFGRLVNKGEIRQVTTQEPPQKGVRRTFVTYDAEPDMIVGWHKPTLPHEDQYVFDVLEHLLITGRSSRLFKRLVKARKAGGVWAYQVPGERFDNLFCISATPLAGHTLEEMEQEVEAELDDLREQLVPAKELEKVLNMVEAQHIWSLKSNRGLASELTRYQLLTGEWRDLEGYVDELRKVTPERIREVVRKYLRPEGRTIAHLVRSEGKGD
jgi:predicted Zn-dependent peptidase